MRNIYKLSLYFIAFMAGYALNVFGNEQEDFQGFINGYKTYALQFPMPITLHANVLIFSDSETKPDQELKSTLKYDKNNLYLSYTNIELNKTFETVCSSDYNMCMKSNQGIEKNNYHITGYINNVNYPPSWSQLSYFSSVFGYFPLFENATNEKGTIPLLELMTNLKDVVIDQNQLSGEYSGIKVLIMFFENSFVPRSVFLDRINSSEVEEPGKLVSYHYEVLKYDIHPKTGSIIPTVYKTTSSSSGGIIPISEKNKDLLLSRGSSVPKIEIPSSTMRVECVIESWQETILTKEDFVFHVKIDNGASATFLDAPQINSVWMDGKIVPKTDENMLRIATEGHKFIPSPKESSFWFILIGLAAVLTVGGIRLYQFWRED